MCSPARRAPATTTSPCPRAGPRTSICWRCSTRPPSRRPTRRAAVRRRSRRARAWTCRSPVTPTTSSSDVSRALPTPPTSWISPRPPTCCWSSARRAATRAASGWRRPRARRPTCWRAAPRRAARCAPSPTASPRAVTAPSPRRSKARRCSSSRTCGPRSSPCSWPSPTPAPARSRSRPRAGCSRATPRTRAPTTTSVAISVGKRPAAVPTRCST